MAEYSTIGTGRARKRRSSQPLAPVVARPRVVLRDDLRDADGMPRPCLALPGRPPLAFPSIRAALAALAGMEKSA